MAQNTGAISGKDVKVEVSIDSGSNYTDISGSFTKIGISGGERKTGEKNTADGDTPIVTAGKRASLDVTVDIVYSEATGDPTSIVRSAYENVTPIIVRWSPKGGTSTNMRYTTNAGVITSQPYPAVDAESGDPMAISFTIKTAKITEAPV